MLGGAAAVTGVRHSPGALRATPVCCRCYSPAAGSLFLRPLPRHPIFLSLALQGRFSGTRQALSFPSPTSPAPSCIPKRTGGRRSPFSPGCAALPGPTAASPAPGAQVGMSDLHRGTWPAGTAPPPPCRSGLPRPCHDMRAAPTKRPGRGAGSRRHSPLCAAPQPPGPRPPPALPAAALGAVAAGRRAPPAGSACPAGRSRRPPRSAPAPQVPDVRRRLQPCRARPGEVAVPWQGPCPPRRCSGGP